jgi:hypothetical protein
MTFTPRTPPTLIAKLYTGWRIQLDGLVYTVIGSMKLRSHYLYLLRTENNEKVSLARQDMLAWQQEGRLSVLG